MPALEFGIKFNRTFYIFHTFGSIVVLLLFMFIGAGSLGWLIKINENQNRSIKVVKPLKPLKKKIYWDLNLIEFIETPSKNPSKFKLQPLIEFDQAASCQIAIDRANAQTTTQISLLQVNQQYICMRRVVWKR